METLNSSMESLVEDMINLDISDDHSQTTESNLMDIDENDCFEEYLTKNYGPAKDRSIYLYKEVLNKFPAAHRPKLVFLDAQFIGKQVTEIAIAHEGMKTIFHRVLSSRQLMENKSTMYNRLHNSRNYYKSRQNLAKRSHYNNQYSNYKEESHFHGLQRFENVQFFAMLPSGSNVIYIVRGFNKKRFLKDLLEKYNISAQIRTYPQRLSIDHKQYVTCYAHNSSQKCSIGNLAQMMNYYNVCTNLLNSRNNLFYT